MATTKTHISLALSGHLSSGKSTLCGRLLYEYGQIPTEEINKFMEIQEEGKSSFFLRKEWQWLVEHEKNDTTINKQGVSCNFKNFQTTTRKWVLIDCPGVYNRNVTSGGLQGDVLFLVVPADNRFEESLAFPKDDIKMGGSLRDAWINQVHRGQLLVAVTMMDENRTTQSHFSKIHQKIISTLSQIGYQNPEKTIPIIPISARDGNNISGISPLMPWWSGCTVLTPGGREVRVASIRDALEDWAEVPFRKLDTGLRLPVFKHYPKNKTFVGSVIEGSLSVDDEVVFIPETTGTPPKVRKISSLQSFRKSIKGAHAGDCNVGLQLLDMSYVPIRGQLMVSPNDILIQHPCIDFIATVHIIHHRVRLNAVPLLAVHTTLVPVQVKQLNWRTTQSKNEKEMNPIQLGKGNIASITFTPKKPVVLDLYEVSPKLGTVFLFQSGHLSMVGKVMDVIVESGRSLRDIQIWLRVRLMFIGCYKDVGSSLRNVPKDVMRLICFYMWQKRSDLE